MIGMVQSLNVSVASALILYEAQRQRQNAGMYQRANSMLPPQEQQRLLFEGGYPVLARVARQKVCLTPTLTSRAKWKPMPRGGLPCRLRGKPNVRPPVRCRSAQFTHRWGAAQSSKLAKIGLHTVQDLLLHLPLRYEDRTHLYPIAELLPGVYATVEGEVLNSNITFGGRRMMTCQISDGTGILTMRFFNFNAAMKNSLATGRRVLAYGEAKRGKYGAEMIHPEYRVRAI